MFRRVSWFALVTFLILGTNAMIGSAAGMAPPAGGQPDSIADTPAGPAGSAGAAGLSAPAAPAGLSVPATSAALLDEMAKVDPAQKLRGTLREAAARPMGKADAFIMVESATPVDYSRYSATVHAWRWPAGEYVAVLKVSAKDLKAIAAEPGVYAVSSAEIDNSVERPGAPGIDVKPLTPADPAAVRARAKAARPWSDPAVRKADAEAVARGYYGTESNQGSGASNEGNSTSNQGAATTNQGSATSNQGGATTNPGKATLKSADKGASPDGLTGLDGWWDVRSGHAAAEAWSMGFRGDDVSVAVLDDAVDYAHPDLKDTWTALPAGHPYAGWPQLFDPEVGLLAIQDKTLTGDRQALRSTVTARSGMIDLYQTSAVTQREISGTMKATACFKPLQVVSITQTMQLAAETCDYIVPNTSKSGTIRYGHHPDAVLAGMTSVPGILGEWTAVIIVDEHTAGVYDTVYVDLNNDRDLSDEKPTTKADPLAWRDISNPPDGAPDLTGGLLYFISDGQLPYPASWVWGLEADIPPAGEIIGLHFVQGGHGTLCGSAIASRGRLPVHAGQSLEFRDLPGNHQPESVNPGMAPKVKLVSVGDVYVAANLFQAAWRYAVFGHDRDRHDDDIQITSNSYGFSDVDNEGWDGDSRLIDYYVRKFSPTTTFFFATGNGAPGYGTKAAPGPSVGVDVAASTQMGSTGVDSITDTKQITYGDIIPFSNRGPGSAARVGPDVAADGAFAAGGFPINGLGDGTLALGTWGGTSRSTPVASGGMALIYQAFKQRQGHWPTYDEARSIMKSGARFNGYDVFTMGAGVLDAGDAVRIASGKHGIYALPSEWEAGSYHGKHYEAFANLVTPGEKTSTQIALENPSDAPVTVKLSAQELRRVGTSTQSVTLDRTKESKPGPVPTYLLPIDKQKIPAGTDLMVTRAVMPMKEFDMNGDQLLDNVFTTGIMQFTDVNGDGKLWHDDNGNGTVDARTMTDSYVEATWADKKVQYDAIEGVITRPLGDAGVDSDLAWYGLACNNPDGTPSSPAQDVTEHVALIERGTCTFAEKILNAQLKGAIAVVVFTDNRPTAIMGGVPTGIIVPGVMLERADGLALQAQLLNGVNVGVKLAKRHFVAKGIDGAPPVVYSGSEIEQYEYMRMTSDGSPRNNWELSVHHPLERWADGLYVALWHPLRSDAITDTHMTLRFDYYAYKPWSAVTLSTNQVTIPAKGKVTVDAQLLFPAGTPSGAREGAIFADYDRGPGDVPVSAPGGYELPNLRTVIPIHAAVATTYDWQHAITLGGPAAADADATYNNGAVRGAFNWGWRAESGDWRFFFLDALTPPANSYWIFRTRWTDSVTRTSDIDTRVYGPTDDRYSNPADKANATEDRSAPDYFGPYTLGLVSRSPYLHRGGGVWPYNTSSGNDEDWLAARASRDGLYEVMLHNVLFSGSQVDMPFETNVASLQLSPSAVVLFGDKCGSLDMTSQIDLPGFQMRGIGLSVPEVLKDTPIQQDIAADPSTSSFKRAITLTNEAARFDVTLHGQTGDDLDLYLLYDANNDNMFTYPQEVLALSGGTTADEAISLTGFQKPGRYEIWVHGFAIAAGASSKFNLTVDVITGDQLTVKNAPTEVHAGQRVKFEVCANLAALAGQKGPANGVLAFGPSGAPALLQVPVVWMRRAPGLIYLPVSLQNAMIGFVPGWLGGQR